MNGIDPNLIGSIIGFVLTLLFFSYLIGDNGLFRLAIHIFIGVAAGYMAVIAINNAIWPRLIYPMLLGTLEERLMTLIPFLAGILLLAKITERFTGLGSPVMAYLAGVGAAAAIGGAVVGTLIPQIGGTINMFDLQAMQASNRSQGLGLFNGMIVLIGVISTLAYFHFGARSVSGEKTRPSWLLALGGLGRLYIAIAFGAIFAGVYAAAMAALVERLDSIRRLFLILMT